jgi:hypothetical protein
MLLLTEVSDIMSLLGEFEETIMDTLERGQELMPMLTQQAQKLGEEFDGELQMTQLIVEGTQVCTTWKPPARSLGCR